MDKTFLKPIEETNPQIQRSASIPGEYEKKKKKSHCWKWKTRDEPKTNPRKYVLDSKEQ